MTNKEKMAQRIGASIDSVLGQGPDMAAMQKQQALDFVVGNGISQSKSIVGLKLAVVASMAMVTVLITLGIFVAPTWEEPQKFWIGNTKELAVEGSWVRGGGDANSIVFENGSRFELVGDSTARVMNVSQKQIQVNLNNGEINAWINGGGGTSWMVEAGPYKVTVVGTVFKVLWIDNHMLEVEVTEGIVSVKGVSLGDQGVSVSKGYRLTTDSKSKETSIRAILHEEKPSSDEPAPLIFEPSLNTDDLVTKAESEEIINRLPKPKKAAGLKAEIRDNINDWRHRCNDGDFKGVMRDAKESQLIDMASTADLETLWQLANAARYIKQPNKAVGLLSAIRQRFPQTGRASTAAFIMAKNAIDLSGNPELAHRWFMTYLSESPKGALREEAMGHLMEICVSGGKTTQAKKIALEYLQHFPEGIFIKRAKWVLSR